MTNETSPRADAGDRYKRVKHSSTHPKFLHSNSTSHKWAFGAIAELVDNAVDPDVSATQLCIDVKEIKGDACLLLMDNGFGMSPTTLHKMLGFGHSEKTEINGHQPIGFYGNGFKSGTMRLGKDVLVLTKCPNSGTMSVGFLSQTFLESIRSPEIIVPMLSWDLKGRRMTKDETEWEENLDAITTYSIYSTESAILKQLKVIDSLRGQAGTIIIISKLRREDGKLELDFKTDPKDIRIAPDDFGASSIHVYQQSRPMQAMDTDVPLDFSLRAYLQVLYRVPRMQIFLRGEKVKSKRIGGILQEKIIEYYRPRDYAISCMIEMGINTENSNLYGVMVYHKNRLIQAYKRIGLQLEANDRGVGILAVVEANHLQPTHNKQDFDDTRAYRHLILKLSNMLKEYWTVKFSNQAQETRRTSQKKKPDILWVQCDYPHCLKWRILPDDYDVSLLQDTWYCNYHPDPKLRDHDAPEEVLDYEATQRRKRMNQAFKDQQKANKKKRIEEQEMMKKLYEENLRRQKEESRRLAQAEVQEKAIVISEQLARIQEERKVLGGSAAPNLLKNQRVLADAPTPLPSTAPVPSAVPLAEFDGAGPLTLASQKEKEYVLTPDPKAPNATHPESLSPDKVEDRTEPGPRRSLAFEKADGTSTAYLQGVVAEALQGVGKEVLNDSPVKDGEGQGPPLASLAQESTRCDEAEQVARKENMETEPGARNGSPTTGIDMDKHKKLLLEKMTSIDARYLKERQPSQSTCATANGLTELEVKLTRNLRAALGVFHLMGVFPFPEDFIRRMSPFSLGEFKLEDLLVGDE